MYIRQKILDEIENILVQTENKKTIVILGPRRSGKTTLLNKILENKNNFRLAAGEDLEVQHYLSSQSINKLQQFVGQNKLLVIDEAQKIPNIGINLKLLADHCPALQIIVTGSSALDLSNQTGEPLTGRKISLQLFPLSQMELNQIEDASQTRANLESRLLYGSYPETILANDNQKRRDYLQELVSSYLYKDILELEGIHKSKAMAKLLQLLAWQIGKEVSLHELGQQLGWHSNTVERYLDLFEKTFVLINITAFSRNLRKEITKKSRYYFYDVGVRNALIGQFNALTLRNDVGELWENYLVIERLKKLAYKKIWCNHYFWRTYSQQEIDWIEEGDGKLNAYEFKWQPRKILAPSEWRSNYATSTFNVINRENYLEFIV